MPVIHLYNFEDAPEIYKKEFSTRRQYNWLAFIPGVSIFDRVVVPWKPDTNFTLIMWDSIELQTGMLYVGM
ncbi:MAG: hypothetical protein RL621_327 [Bacteroidota bacterium]|jgi:hypothetical protein